MTITLKRKHERIIQEQIASGQFRSVNEVLDHLLAPLEQQDSRDTAQEQKSAAHDAAQRIREMRKGVTLDRPPGMSLREYAHIGHKH